MPIHIVGLTRPATIRISQRLRFRGVRRTPAEIPEFRVGAPLDENAFRCAWVDCQLGVDAKPGAICLECPRLLGWKSGAHWGELVVSCQWTQDDPVTARMTGLRALVHVSKDIPAAAAAELAVREGVWRVLVLEEGRLVGIASRRDLGVENGATLVGDVMSPDVYVIDTSATLGEAAAAMIALNVGCLPVVTGGRLRGILTRGDLIRAGVPENRFA
jgi:CBS domain-containing protein